MVNGRRARGRTHFAEWLWACGSRPPPSRGAPFVADGLVASVGAGHSAPRPWLSSEQEGRGDVERGAAAVIMESLATQARSAPSAKSGTVAGVTALATHSARAWPWRAPAVVIGGGARARALRQRRVFVPFTTQRPGFPKPQDDFNKAAMTSTGPSRRL